MPDLSGELDAVRLPDPFDQAALDWWRLGLRHLQLRQTILKRAMEFTLFEATHRFHRVEPDYVNHFRRGAQVERNRLDALFNDIRSYFADRQLSDTEEFVQGRYNALAMMLQWDWAATIIPHVPPKTVR